MATHRSTRSSFLALSLLLLLSASLVDGVSNVKESCTKTPYLELCMNVLSASPESKTADARGLVQIAMRAAAKMGAAAVTSARAEQGKLNISDPKGNLQSRCMDSCAQNFKDAVSNLDDKGKTIDDAKLIEVRRFFEMTQHQSASWKWKWNCDDCREGHAKMDLISKNNDFQKIMGVIPALIKQTPGGDKPLPPKPTS